MPWKVTSMSERRRCFIDSILVSGCSVAKACRTYGISRKTAYKWLGRFQENPDDSLENRSRKPHHSPLKTAAQVEDRLIAEHGTWGWGARKVHQIVKTDLGKVPSVTTVQAILKRRGCAGPRQKLIELPPIRFERSQPNQLWQMDFKGPIEIARTPMHTLSLQDDCSRFLLRIDLCENHSHALVWNKLWHCFGEYGLPQELLSDNEFSTGRQAPRTLTWLEARLIRLHIKPIHGRPYHPQTQGKIENLHGSYERELLPRARRDCFDHFIQDAQRYRRDFNNLRPHEGIGMATPITRWKPSPRPRPSHLPPLVYPQDATLRKVSVIGEISWNGYRIKAGQGIKGEYVQIKDLDIGLAVYYAHHQVRLIDKHALVKNQML